MGEIKQANFRVDTDAAKAFRDFCDQQGFNQSEGFSYLLKTLELDQAKNQLPERVTEVKQFEQSIKTLQALYLSSLELNANAEARVKEQFLADLERKDKTIDELREKIASLEKQKNDLESTTKEAIADKTIAEEQKNTALEKLEAIKKSASDTEQINVMLSAKIADTEQKLAKYDELIISEQKAHQKILELTQALSDQKKDSEIAKERAVTSKEREMLEQIQSAKLESATLAGKLEMLEKRIKELTASTT